MTAPDTPLTTPADLSPSRALSGPRRTFLALVAIHALSDCYGGMWPIFKKLAQLDLSYAGLIATLGTLMMMTQPVFGQWADHGRRRTFVLWGGLLSMATMLLGPLALARPSIGDLPAYALMLLTMVVARIGAAMFHPAGASIAGNSRAGRRSTLVALFIAGGMLGFSASHLLFAWAYEHLAGHTQWLMLPGLLIIAAGWRWCRPAEATDQRPKVKLSDLLHSVSILRTRMWTLFAILALLSGQALALQFLLPELMELRGQSQLMINGGGFGLTVLGSVLLMIPAGQLADRWGQRRTLALCLLLNVVFYIVLLKWRDMSPAMTALLLLLSGGCLGTANPLGIALGQHLAPRRASSVSGVLMGLAWSIGGLAPSVVAYLAEKPSLGVEGALLVMSGCAVLALLLMLLVPGHLPDEPTDAVTGA